MTTAARRTLYTAGRTVGGALAAWTLVNVVAGLRSPGVDLNTWWIDLRALPGWAGAALLAIGAALIGAWAVRPRLSPMRRRLTVAVTLLLTAFAVVNAAVVIDLMIRGQVASDLPVPISAVVAGALVCLAWLMRVDPPRIERRCAHAAGAIAVLAALSFGFPLSQMLLYGKTDYRRSADAIVVLGCRAYADGRPSDALADRVATAARLYHAGHAPLLIMSGGPGDGAIDEPTAMKRYAVSLGVPAGRIVTDPAGVNTAATSANARRLFSQHGVERALVVSHFYHLPRVKLAFEREGLRVYTVPAEERYLLTQLPRNMVREVAAWWWYYVHAV